MVKVKHDQIPDELWVKAHNILNIPRTPVISTENTLLRLCKSSSVYLNFITYMIEEGFWTLPDPVEKLREEARELVAQEYDKVGMPYLAERTRKGKADSGTAVKAVLSALARRDGVELPT